MYAVVRKALVFSRSDLPRDVTTNIIRLLLTMIMFHVPYITSRLTTHGYQHIKKLDVIIKKLTKLFTNERKVVRIDSLTSLERRALYSYRDHYGGIAIKVMTNRGTEWYVCRKCQGAEEDDLWTCPRCNGRGVTRGYFREDVRITAI